MTTNHGNDSELDRALDATLAKYSAVEPRAGLEQRILSNLRTAEPHTPTAWRWGVAAAALALVLIGIAISLRFKEPAPLRIATHPPSAISDPFDSSKQFAHRVALPARPRKQHLPHSRETVVDSPKLDTFPSPGPLSEQEKILATYVSQFHEEAVLIARARTQASKKEEQQLAAANDDSQIQ